MNNEEFLEAVAKHGEHHAKLLKLERLLRKARDGAERATGEESLEQAETREALYRETAWILQEAGLE